MLFITVETDDGIVGIGEAGLTSRMARLGHNPGSSRCWSAQMRRVVSTCGQTSTGLVENAIVATVAMAAAAIVVGELGSNVRTQ